MFTHNKDLTPYTTFNIPVKARLFAEYTSERELLKISRSNEYIDNEIIHIGGGSDLLFLEDFDGLVLHSAIKGMKLYRKDENTVFAIVGAGEKWTDFVDWCIENNLVGVENLAGIPGEVGASAVQNVGAYGVEAKDVIHAVECFDTFTRKTVTLRAAECNFRYRDSIFKHEEAGRYFILRVSFRLTPGNIARNLEYGALARLKEKNPVPSISEVAQEVVRLRDAKLPNPAHIGSAGSFFKNPILNHTYFEEVIKPLHPDIPVYKEDDDNVKLSAGWMIDHAGLKGYRIGDAEVYDRNALVIINRGNATASDVLALAEHIQTTVINKYGVRLYPEVLYISTSVKVTILGSGTSKGVPEIGCNCAVCKSEDSKDKRLRSSVLVETMGMRLLIDAGPDFRRQALDHSIDKVDAVLLTHEHYDHVGGIDDLRPLCINGDIPLYMREDLKKALTRRIDYCFKDSPYPGVPKFDVHVIDDKPFYIGQLKIVPVTVMHGKLPIFGYRIGDFAYITDAKTISEEEKMKLYGLKVLIVNALRVKEHFAHFTLQEALDLIDELKPEKAYLTHISHELGLHEEVEKTLPANVHLAYDGEVINIR